MRCEELERIVFDGGPVTPQMREHAKGCEACRALLENRDVLALCRAMDDRLEAPAAFTARWRSAVRREAERAQRPGVLRRLGGALARASRGHAVRWAAVACCALALVGVGASLGARTSMDTAYDTIMAAPKSRAAGYGSDSKIEMAEMAEMDDGVMLNAAAGTAAASSTGETRKIVRTAQMDIRVEDMDAALADIRAQTEALGGSIDYSEVSGEPGNGRYASLELSLPGERLDSFLSGAGALGEVTREQSRATDMTATYQDNASRLESARAQKAQLDALYAAATDMTDIVTITDALFEVQQEIDSLTGQNRWIDDRVAFSRVTLYLTEAEAGEEEKPFIQRMSDSVHEGFEAMGTLAGEIALFAAWALPWAVLLAVIAVAVWRVRRRRR